MLRPYTQGSQAQQHRSLTSNKTHNENQRRSSLERSRDMTTPLSVILIQIDSLNRHFLEAYGNDWVRAPNLAAFAARATVFDQHFVGSLPCMPARREIWAGTEEHWWRGWGPLEPWDEPLAYLAGRVGVTTQLVTDHYHLFEWGASNYAYDFTGYDFVRGHEHDNWRTDSVREVPDWARKMIRQHGEGGMIYLRNVQDFRDESDFFGAQVMARTADWLERNHTLERFFLHVDCFDVHEPFHIPEPYRSMYTDDDYRLYTPWPHYGRASDPAILEGEAELNWVRAQFAGKLSLVDAWFGRVLEVLEKRNLWERCVVVVTTDHGHYLGEHDRIGKPGSPMWHTLCQVPLMIWHPDGKAGSRVSAFTQTLDLYPTILEWLGLHHEPRPWQHGSSFAGSLHGHASNSRPRAVYGYSNLRVGITQGEWTLLRDHDPSAAPAYWYSHGVEHLNTRSFAARKNRPLEFDLAPGTFIPGLETPVWRLSAGSHEVRNLGAPRADLLYHNPSDPRQERDLSLERPDVARQLEDGLREHMRQLQVPDEQFARLRL
jgi:arylsulfatase A-like enzyme